MPSYNEYTPFNSTPHSEVVRMGKYHAMERVEVRLHPFLTSAEDTLIVQWERCRWYERSCKEKIPACTYLPFRECCTIDRLQLPVG